MLKNTLRFIVILEDYKNEHGNEKEVTASFNVGDVLIEIINLETNKFSPGEIAKFTLEVESKWNKQIDDVYAVIEVFDLDGNSMGSAESKKISVSEWGKEKIDIFWDSTGITPGMYEVKAILYYADKTSEKTFDIEVKKKGYVKIIVVVGAVILLIMYLIRARHSRRKRKELMARGLYEEEEIRDY